MHVECGVWSASGWVDLTYIIDFQAEEGGHGVRRDTGHFVARDGEMSQERRILVVRYHTSEFIA